MRNGLGLRLGIPQMFRTCFKKGHSKMRVCLERVRVTVRIRYSTEDQLINKVFHTVPQCFAVFRILYPVGVGTSTSESPKAEIV